MIHEFPDPSDSETIVYDPPLSDLRSFSRPFETTTEFGSPSYVSDVKSRSAARTKNAIDDDLSRDDTEQLRRAHRELERDEFVCVDRQLGRHADHSYSCRLFVPKPYSRIALSWATLLEPAQSEPDFLTLQIPEWADTRIRVFPDEGVTYVLGSDYTGEAKKSFLRLFMYEAKNRGGLGLHAGSKRLSLRTEGEDQSVGQLFLGLSATGKTTLTCHGFDLTDGEETELLQDDVCALLPNGTAAGSEGNGLYIKTLGLSPENHRPLYHAATQSTAVLENVHVTDDGTVDFTDGSLTTNGRASIRRRDLPNATTDIDLQEADHVFFITRNPLMPPIAKLSPAEGAAVFMLGESIQTSAGDPDRAGETVRVVGTNPFIIGSRGTEGNRFLKLVRSNEIKCFIINTGCLGDEAKDIKVEHTVAIIRAVARRNVAWTLDDRLGLRIPERLGAFDITEFYPPDYVDDYDDQLKSLREDRQEYLAGFPDLKEEILGTPLSLPASQTRLD